MVNPSIGDHHLGATLEENGVVAAREAYPLAAGVGAEGSSRAFRHFVAPLGDAPNAEARFREIAGATAHMRHRNVAEVHAFGVEDKHPYLIIAPGDVRSLHALLKEAAGGCLSPAEVALIGKDIASALEATSMASPAIHHLGLMPESILIDSKGHAILSDFGVTDLLSEGEAERSLMLAETAAYESPESMAGEAGAPTDIFSLSVCLYEALTGKRPFPGDTPYQTVIKIKLGQFERLDAAALSIPEELVELIHRGLVANPDSRPTAADVVSGLGAMARRSAEARAPLGERVRAGLRASQDGAATLPPGPNPAAEMLGSASFSLPSPATSEEEHPDLGHTFRKIGHPAAATAPSGGFEPDLGDGDATIMHFGPPKAAALPSFPEPSPPAPPRPPDPLPHAAPSTPEYGPGFSPPAPLPSPPAPSPPLSHQSGEQTLPSNALRAPVAPSAPVGYGTGSHALPPPRPQPSHHAYPQAARPQPSHHAQPQVARPQPSHHAYPQATAPTPESDSATVMLSGGDAPSFGPEPASPAQQPGVAPAPGALPNPSPGLAPAPKPALGALPISTNQLMLVVGGVLLLVVLAFLVVVVLVVLR